jgi:regulator of nucleoside diphosphate kinase
MHIGQPITLTPRSYALLEGLLHRLEPGSEVLRAMLARKLAVADIVFAQEIGPEVATLDSRVRFRIDGGSTREGTLVWTPDRELPGAALPVTEPRGLALLGMRAGRTAAVPTGEGEVEHLTLEAVLHQPESARWPGPVEPPAGSPGQGALPAMVTSLRAVRARRAAARGRSLDGDDPGPGAA